MASNIPEYSVVKLVGVLSNSSLKFLSSGAREMGERKKEKERGMADSWDNN